MRHPPADGTPRSDRRSSWIDARRSPEQYGDLERRGYSMAKSADRRSLRSWVRREKPAPMIRRAGPMPLRRLSGHDGVLALREEIGIQDAGAEGEVDGGLRE